MDRVTEDQLRLFIGCMAILSVPMGAFLIRRRQFPVFLQGAHWGFLLFFAASFVCAFFVGVPVPLTGRRSGLDGVLATPYVILAYSLFLFGLPLLAPALLGGSIAVVAKWRRPVPDQGRTAVENLRFRKSIALFSIGIGLYSASYFLPVVSSDQPTNFSGNPQIEAFLRSELKNGTSLAAAMISIQDNDFLEALVPLTLAMNVLWLIYSSFTFVFLKLSDAGLYMILWGGGVIVGTILIVLWSPLEPRIGYWFWLGSEIFVVIALGQQCFGNRIQRQLSNAGT